VELKEYDGWYDTSSRRLKQWLNCKIKDGYCEAGLSTLDYNLPQDCCQLTLLKEGYFDEYRGKLYKNHFHSNSNRFKSKEERDQYMADLIKDKAKARAKMDTEDTPRQAISRHEKVGMRFIKKETVSRCDTKMFATNYKGFYLSKIRVHDITRTGVEPTDMKWEAYVNNKLAFLFNRQEQKMENIYLNMVSNDCKLNREILQLKLDVATVNTDSVAHYCRYRQDNFEESLAK